MLKILKTILLKKIFLEKGIHIYNYQNKSVFNDDEDKITFQIRTNENEREFQNKLLRVKNEINLFGVDFKKVFVNTRKYPRKRRPTPGTVLIQETKQIKE